MTPVAKGIWLAVANVCVIALALSMELRVREGDVTQLVIFFASLPAVLLGAILGTIAEATSAYRVPWRLCLLALPACGLVVVLASAFDMLHFVPHACIPTFLAASILERLTRAAQLVPVARA